MCWCSEISGYDCIDCKVESAWLEISDIDKAYLLAMKKAVEENDVKAFKEILPKTKYSLSDIPKSY